MRGGQAAGRAALAAAAPDEAMIWARMLIAQMPVVGGAEVVSGKIALGIRLNYLHQWLQVTHLWRSRSSI
ncbi:hypothetical protein Aple_048940 [Acrocarpospora pleiomorpha]|uniref:Uncharacterized protein n=1 Tax=Acrocarpospora pleiomorpha TaxID=90975 RepID=A0A5M3XKQ2_9ACTN|nr:hypothetical protein Aple_048940 [Acrocarpospora pleiomorpha]